MALSQTQVRDMLAAVGAFIEKLRPPPKIRKDLDYRADIKNATVTIVSMRPAYNNKRRIVDHPIARVRWIGTKKEWRIYWMRADLKWHSYTPESKVKTLTDAFAEIARDPFCCFFG